MEMLFYKFCIENGYSGRIEINQPWMGNGSIVFHARNAAINKEASVCVSSVELTRVKSIDALLENVVDYLRRELR